MTLSNAGELLSRWSTEATAERVAVVDGSSRVTFAELLGRVRAGTLEARRLRNNRLSRPTSRRGRSVSGFLPGRRG